jgi:tetratricopeptide (TPR) repeat protein
MSQSVKVMIVTLVILVCAGGTLSMTRDSLEKIFPRSFITPIFSYLETKKPKDLQVVFLGSSRIHSCINRDLFAKLTGIEQSKILLLEIDGSGTWEEFSVCRRFPGLFDSAPMVIIEVEPWMFNNNYFSQGGTLFIQPGFYQWATVQDRLEFPDLKIRVLSTVDYIWPISERRSLQGWSKVIDGLIHKSYPDPMNPDDIPKYHYDPSAYRKVAEEPKGTAQFQAHAALNDFEFAPYKAEYLARLVRLAEKKSKKIILLQPPLRNEYIDIMFDNPKYLIGHIQVVKFLHSLENEKVSTIIWERPEDCGLNDTVFIDYGHFNREGAYIFTQILYKELNNRGLTGLHAPVGISPDTVLNGNIQRLENFVQLHPKDYDAHYQLGNLYYRINRDKALEYYQEALLISPESMNAMEKMLMLYSKKGDYGKSLEVLNRMQELHPENANTYYNIACIKAKQNKVGESVEWLKMSVSKGFNDRSLLVTDKDLDNIKEDQGYMSILKSTK